MKDIEIMLTVDPNKSKMTGKSGTFKIKYIRFLASKNNLYLDGISERDTLLTGGYVLTVDMVPNIIKAFEQIQEHITDTTQQRPVSREALDLADVILNGKTYLFTEHGRKTRTGLAEMIDNTLLEMKG